MIKEIGNNSYCLKKNISSLKNTVTDVDANSIMNTNKLFFNNYQCDPKFLNGKTSFSLFESHFQGHMFEYESTKDPEQTYFDFIRFVVTLDINLPIVKSHFVKIQRTEHYAMR